MHGDHDTSLGDDEARLAERGAALIATAVSQVEAPQSLREAIERQRAATPAPAPFWRRRGWVPASLAAIAVIAAAVIGLQSGPSSTGPTLAAVESAAASEATGPAPELAGGEPPVLDAHVGALRFPDWRESFGWTAVGRRDDELSGRAVTTVFYRNGDGAELGYSVVGGDPLGELPPGREVRRAGNAYHVDQAGERTLVAWTQQGHTCVIVGPSAVPDGRLVALAASRNT